MVLTGFRFHSSNIFTFYPHIAADGLLILDDIHIRTIHELYRFLRAEKMFELIDVIERTAFFRRTTAHVFDPFGDGWWLQSYNRKRLLRYTWQEVLRNSLPSPVRYLLRQSRALLRSRIASRMRHPIQIVAPQHEATVGETALVRGRAELPAEASLWLFARRADSSGWWPQGRGSITILGSQWERMCKLGEADDAGYPFEIAVVALDQPKQRRVARWFDESSRSGRWDAITLPEPMPGTCIARIRVVRAGASNK